MLRLSNEIEGFLQLVVPPDGADVASQQQYGLLEMRYSVTELAQLHVANHVRTARRHQPNLNAVASRGFGGWASAASP